MKILFVAKHGCGDNQDEDAISYSFEQMGHQVLKVHEKLTYRTASLHDVVNSERPDFCLFLKWENFGEIQWVRSRCPCFLWYFDLVSSTDSTLTSRMQFRQNWFKNVLPHCMLAFCTDGDWVDQDQTGKLRWLMQGMDERVAGFGKPLEDPWPPLLFTGMISHGAKREEHIQELRARYGDQFRVLGDGSQLRKHGRELADIFASVKIVIAPDGPCTDRYWSNRIYNTLGLGGFLLHPYCKDLAIQFSGDGTISLPICLYTDRKNLNELIDFYLLPENFGKIMGWRKRGFEAIMARHTYRHRCEELLRQVMEVI